MDKKPHLSVTIIGHNEGYHLHELLPSLSWADEIIYVDCSSDDDSTEIARKYADRVFLQPNNPNLNVNKAFAMEKATGDWIFYLDPDERIPAETSEEILETIKNPGKYAAFTIRRRNHYFGRWLKHGSQYPDIQLRLFKKDKAAFPQKHVHEKLQVHGPVGMLKEDMLHFPYLNISQYFLKFDFYTSFEANWMKENGKTPSIALAFRYCFTIPFSRFLRRYFLKMGFRDGWQGFFAALFDGLNFVVRYFKLIEISENKKNHNE